MSNLLKDADTKGMEEATDSLGFTRLETNIYDGVVKNAYATESESSESVAVHLIVDVAEDPDSDDSPTREYYERLTVLSRKGTPYYVKDSGAKIPLSGYTVIDDLSRIICDCPITELETEKRKVKIGEDIVKVDTYVDLVGADISLAIQKIRQNKRVKAGSDYVDTNDAIEINRIEKVLDSEDLSTARELSHGEEPKYADNFLAKFQGKVSDRFKPVQDGGAGSSKRGTPGKSSGESSKRSRLSLGRKK